jgi:excisionase family DNA binding protein
MISRSKSRENPGWLRRSQVAELFDVSVSTVTRWARCGFLPVRRTPGGHYRFSAEAVKRMSGAFAPEELTRLD